MGKIIKAMKGHSFVTKKKVETRQETFNPELLYKTQHYLTGPHNVPVDYICKTNMAGEHRHLLEKFFQFVYGRDFKSASSYYMKHRITGEYLKKGYFKKIPPIYQLTFSVCALRLSADICREALEDPRQLTLNFHVRCIVNFAAHQLGIPGMTLAGLLEHHRNDDFRGITQSLTCDDTDVAPDFLGSRFFGILAYWAKSAYELLMGDEQPTEKAQMLAVLCWHAIAYLFNSRTLVLAGREFPPMGEISYLPSITSFERKEADYDDFYEQKQPPVFAPYLYMESQDVEQGESAVGIPEIIANTFSRLTGQLDDSRDSACALSSLESLFEDMSYNNAVEQWSGMMTPEAIEQRRAETTKRVFTLIPAQIAHLSKLLQATADQFEIEDISFCLPTSFTDEALSCIDYNQLYLAASDSLPRLQIKSQKLDEIRQYVELINNLVKSYSDAYQPEPRQIPRPSILRKMGVISQQVSDQMELFARQWTCFIEAILSEHREVLTLTLEYQKSDSERRELSRRASIRQQEEVLKLKKQLADTQLEHDRERKTIRELLGKLDQREFDAKKTRSLRTA